ncbi:MAG: cyclic nucleotide-binding domain-containing protein [Gammaproteobacteria bacterium]|nr:MAG: cyclic nucleotide-binding domain-containing protein [Gammaproteobacteria bacterium]
MTDIFELILLLKSSPVFEQVATEDLRYVAQAMEPESYLGGERIFDINENGDYMYLVQNGRIGISLNEDPTAKEFVAELGPGECFGEMNLLDDLPRSATAHVLEDSNLLSLEKGQLRRLIIHYPELAMGMLKGLSLRLRDTNLK